MEAVIADFHQAVVSLLAQQRRDAAKFALRRKKMHEKQLENLMTFLVQVEGLLLDVEVSDAPRLLAEDYVRYRSMSCNYDTINHMNGLDGA